MSQIDWSKAPEWATVRLKNVHDYSLFAWAESYQENVRFQRDDTTHTYPWLSVSSWTQVATRPVATEWNGTGLPPAGTVCEFREYCGTWAECTIIGEFKGRIICGCNATGTVGYIDLEELRPIRTPEQIAADEREAAIEDMYQIYKNSPGLATQQGMAALYDHGYRKQSTKQDEQK